MPLDGAQFSPPPNASPLPFDEATSDGLSEFHMSTLSVDWADRTGPYPKEPLPLRNAICPATAFQIANSTYGESLRFSCQSDEDGFKVAAPLMKCPNSTVRCYHDSCLCDPDDDNLVFAEEVEQDPFRIAFSGLKQYSADDTSDGPPRPHSNIVLRRTAFNRRHLNKRTLVGKPTRRVSRHKGSITRSSSSFRHAHYYSAHRAIQVVKDGYDGDTESEHSGDHGAQRVDQQIHGRSSKLKERTKQYSNLEFEDEDEAAFQMATILDPALPRVNDGLRQRPSQQLSSNSHRNQRRLRISQPTPDHLVNAIVCQTNTQCLPGANRLRLLLPTSRQHINGQPGPSNSGVTDVAIRNHRNQRQLRIPQCPPDRIVSGI